MIAVMREMQPDLVELRRELHQVAEVGLDLPRTQERVLTALQGLPLEITTGGTSTAITAVLRGTAGPGPAVLLRADMDALPVVERTGLPFAAAGEVMHACGHDLHTAMLVGAAHALVGERARMTGDVVFMFQPGEEGCDGARHMIREGVLDAAGRRAEAAYALHVISNFPAGRFTTRPGPVLASASRLAVTVRGRGGHGSAPHHAQDPLPAACEMVTALHAFVSRTFDVFDPVVLTVGRFQAGTAFNVIPDEVFFEATLRAFSPETEVKLLAGVTRVVQGVASAWGLELVVEAEPMYPPTVNDAGRAALVAELVRERFGEERYAELPTPIASSEDFSRVLEAVPGAMVLLGAAPQGQAPWEFNHSPRAVFDEAVLADGAALYAELALQHVAADASTASASPPVPAISGS
jgi:hippurate hydrolase